MKIVEYLQKNYKGYNLIEGFPSPDLTATITTKYLIDTLKMEKIGHVESKMFFPVVRINKGLPEAPIRLYASDKHKLIAILPDQIIPGNLVFEYCKVLLEWANKKKIEGIYTVASLQAQKPSTNVYAVTNNKYGLANLKKNEIELIKDGLTSGIGAILLSEEKKLPVYLIMGAISEKTSYEVAARILETLNKLFQTQIDTQPLRKQSDKLIQNVKKQLDDVEANKEDKKQIMYT